MLMSSSVVSHDASVLLRRLGVSVYSDKNYLLKDNSVSSKPVYGREKGVFITPQLVLDLRISKRKMTAAKAKLFCKMEKRPIPTLFQALLLQLNIKTVNERLEAIGMKDVLSTYVLDYIWHQGALDKASSTEERYVVTLLPYGDYQELDCVCIPAAEDVDNTYMLDRKCVLRKGFGNEYKPRLFKLLGVWNRFDLLLLDSDYNTSQWLFFRNRDTNELCHYIANNTYEELEILSDELYVHDRKVYQAVDGGIVLIHTLGGDDSAGFSDGKLCLCRNEAYCGEMPAEYVNTYYVKGADGLFTQCDN